MLLLSLAASASAAPQYLPYGSLPMVYNPMMHHQAAYYPNVAYPYANPYANHPAMVYPTHVNQPSVYSAGMSARNIWPFTDSNHQTSKGTLDTSTTTCGGALDSATAGAVACTVTGEVEFSQNALKDILCGNNAGLTINLQGSGMKANNKYTVYVATAVILSSSAVYTKVFEFTAPITGANNGVNLYYCADGLNVDGTNSKTAVDGKYLVIMDTTSTGIIVGFTNAVLA